MADLVQWLNSGARKTELPGTEPPAVGGLMTITKHVTCTVEECEKPHEAQSFCSTHYRKFRLYGDPLGRAVRQYDLICAAEDCDKVRRNQAWCSAHYQRFKKWGDANHVPYSSLKVHRICAVDGCDERHAANGLCGKHNRRKSTTGSADDPGKPYKGKYHDGGYWYVWCPEHPNASVGYILEHRLIMSVILDRALLSNENVHHINGDRMDNRPENLELWSTAQPSGQRIEDKVRHARENLNLYGDMFPLT